MGEGWRSGHLLAPNVDDATFAFGRRWRIDHFGHAVLGSWLLCVDAGAGGDGGLSSGFVAARQLGIRVW